MKRVVASFEYVFVFLLMFSVAELGARLYDAIHPSLGAARLELGLQPYMMFTTHPSGGLVWTDVLRGGSIKTKMKFNNFGFAVDRDFTFAPVLDGAGPREKAGKKLVLMTGGSAVYGVGASANEFTIPSQLEKYLNTHSTKYTYEVVNLAMGSWIAYQQFVGLSLFGHSLDPDWVVVMDGRNDGVVACAHGNGVGNPAGWPPLLALANSHDEGVARLIRMGAANSAVIRLLTGYNPQERNYSTSSLVFDASEPDKRFAMKIGGLTLAEQYRQLGFYVESESKIASLFHRANLIFSTQPVYYDNVVSPNYRPAFRPSADPESRLKLKADLDTYFEKNRNTTCDWRMIHFIQSHFLGLSALKLAEWAPGHQAKEPGRKVMYENAEAALPFDESRKDYFIDDVHFSDAGGKRLGAFFGEIILSAEAGVPFDFAGFAGKYEKEAFSPPPPAASPTP
jgi:hypothetical protein